MAKSSLNPNSFSLGRLKGDRFMSINLLVLGRSCSGISYVNVAPSFFLAHPPLFLVSSSPVSRKEWQFIDRGFIWSSNVFLERVLFVRRSSCWHSHLQSLHNRD